MRKYRYKRRVVKEEKLITVICDFCKQEIDKSFVEHGGFGRIKISFGYPSKFDMTYFEGEICDECFEKLFKEKLKEERMMFI